MGLFTQKNLNYDNIHDSLDGQCLDLATQINSHFLFRIYTANDEVKYLQISRMDSCQKIVEEFLNQLKSKKAPQIPEAYQSQEFQNYSYLFSAKVTDTGIKVSRLPNSICNLPSMSMPGVRYYVTECSSDVKISPEIERSMQNECSTELLNFNHLTFAKILTFFNFYKFTRVSPKEYLASIFKAVKYDTSNLKYFENRCDQELYWVVGSILAEPNIKERVNLIVHFIKIASNLF
ncbi:Rap guanine nucleotide exchange factor 2 [Thelohanellus kitauei]|uniref:Rap guanine nucleotide exchange factor 2 n=1 Tax=Thelohanellus kitauei TaxID=669202 RepID=A0A0C2JJY8_THEKT|nr:Rap guanine nucleotide exchange factor 2 [Thelohanellus kitauei]